MDAVLVDWLQPGALPIVSFVQPSNGTFRCIMESTIEEGGDIVPVWYQVTYTRTGERPRAIVPMLDLPVSELYDFLQNSGIPEGKCVYFGIRAIYALADVQYASIGVAVFDDAVEGAVPYDFRFAPMSLIHTILFLDQKDDEPRRLRAEAAVRARKLLFMGLDPEQQAMFGQRHAFRMIAGDGRTYEIESQMHGNVYLIENDKKAVQYCIVLTEEAPLEDQLLGQKLLLETDVPAFLAIANARDLRG